MRLEPVPAETGSGSASAPFEDEDRDEIGGGSSCELDTDERFDVVVPGGGSGLRIFL